MGWRRAFDYSDPADIFREHAALSAFENEGRRLFDIGALAGLSDAAYRSLSPVQWPCPQPGITSQRLFGDGRFATPDRRGRMVPLTASAPAAKQADHALTLNTGRVRDQWHTMTRTGRVPHLMTHVAAPRIAMHPRDAATCSLEDGALARIHNAQAAAILRVAIDPAMRMGDVFVPMHWTDQFSSSGPVGRLVHALADPFSGQPDLKGSKVRVSPIAEIWRGILLCQGGSAPALGDTVHWTRAPVDGGYSFELSGWSPLANLIASETALRALLHLQDGAELIAYSDPKRSVYRYAGLAAGRLEACVFFATPQAHFHEADQVRPLLGQPLAPSMRISLLAGLETNAAPKGRIVCSCFSVDEAAIRDAISGKRLSTPAEIGGCLNAGTNCGSCIPELKKLINETAGAAAIA
jgi:assimilatory nitrate reductase catalytic subunit